MLNYLFNRKEFGLSAYWGRDAELVGRALTMRRAYAPRAGRQGKKLDTDSTDGHGFVTGEVGEKLTRLRGTAA